MSVIEQSKYVEHEVLKLAWLKPNPDNPNEMTDEEFNMLSDNMERIGPAEPPLVWMRKFHEDYLILGGHHRTEVLQVNGVEETMCVIITDPNFSEEMAKLQTVRMNAIHGTLNPKKFMKLHDSLAAKYTSEAMKQAFGFTDDAVWQGLIKSMSKSLPEAIQPEFKKQAEEIKTVDGLSALLNKMFAKFGDTLPYGYMILDYGKQDSFWLRMQSGGKKDLMALSKACLAAGVTLDSIIAQMIHEKIADKEKLVQSIALGTKAVLPDYQKAATEDNNVN